MNPLMAALQLGQASGDPNDIPTGRYDGVVTKSEYTIKDDFTINHVVTLQVVSNDQYNGKTKSRWYKLGENAVDQNGQPTTNLSALAGFKDTMTADNKSWYKKLWLDLGISEHLINSAEATPDMLVNKPCVFGIAERQGYKNVNFIDKRDAAPVAPIGMGMMQPSPGMPFGQPSMGQQVQQPYQQPQQQAPYQQQPVSNQPVQQPQAPQPTESVTQNPWENQPQQAQPGNPWADLTSDQGLQQQANQLPQNNQQATPSVTFGGGPATNDNQQQIAPGVPPVS